MSADDDGHLSDARIGRIALRVADFDETAAFYRDVVGLAVLDREGDAVVFGIGETPLLRVRRAPDVPERAPTDAGLFHAAFRVPSRAALGEALSRVRDRWRLDGASDHRVSEALYLADPEGNGVEIYRDRPRAEWPTEADGSVAMTTEPLDLDAVAAAAETRGDSGDATPADAPGAGSIPVDRVPPGTDVGHVHLEVASLDAFESAYVDGLGFEVRQAAPDVRFVAADGYHHVGANTWRGRTTPATGRGLDWFEVVVPDAAALAAVRERLDAVADATTGETEFAVDDTDDGIALTDVDGIKVRIRTE
ncbi:VOC family protein [Halorubrum sp. BV1]|uniref:VOC family protein n=1 Tax=Halorubrum sp. BV1 TaxID=1498500 RepID=UPI000679DB64|nr:VOC family protein [Halorubrum sp. BV1]